MPANTYPSNAPVSPLADKTNRYSSGSTASASSSGNWSNRGSIGQSVSSGMRPNHLPVAGLPDPPSGLPPPPPMGSDPYNGNTNEDFPPPPPEMLNNNHSPQGTMRYNNDMRHSPQSRGSPSHTAAHNNYSSNSSPKKLNYPAPPWLAGAKYSDESGIELSSSNENVERRYRKGTGTLPLFKGPSSKYTGFYNRPLKLSAAQSIDNMMGSREAMSALGPRRPHSDGTAEFRVDSSRSAQFSSRSKGKDADRIYEWLRQHRLSEYTNNFTLAGYDMPTIAKMTPEDLTAIGVTKPAHRKRITAMISKMKEPDPLPKFIPGDVVTWLRLLDLSQYYNTLISNDYGTVEKASEITWEDLQEIGINRLGDQKKFTLAIKRLNYLKKHSGDNKLQSPSYPASLNSDSGSISPAASLEGHNQTYPPPAQFAPSSQSPHQQDEAHLMVKRRSGGLRSSRESLASDISVGSVGSQGSHDLNHRQDAAMRQTSATNQTINEGIESTYIPTMSSFRVPGQGTKKSTSLHNLDDAGGADGQSKGMSFSTFKQPQISPEDSSRRFTGRSTESLDRLMAAQAMAERFKRNSIEGGSSIASSGSGSGEQPAVKLKKSLPPAPPKRTNSMSSNSRDCEQKTATIGRKKSLKKFREEMQVYRAEMEAEFAAGHFDGQTDRIEGYATIKRSSSKKADPIKKLQRSQSQEGDVFRGIAPSPVLPPPMAVMSPTGHMEGRDYDEGLHHQHTDVSHMQHNMGIPQSMQHMQGNNYDARTNMSRTGDVASSSSSNPVHTRPQHIPVVPPFPQAYQPTSNINHSVNTEHSSIQSPYPAVPAQMGYHPHNTQNGGNRNMERIVGSVTTELSLHEHPHVPRTQSSQSKHSYQPPYAHVPHSNSATEVTKPTRMVMTSPTDAISPAGGGSYQFVCPPDVKSALPSAQQPVVQGLKYRKSSSDRLLPGQPRKASVSEQSTSSSDSGGSNGRRPNSLEWKNQGSKDEDVAPIIQPALANPLENIWRPKSRHLSRSASGEKGESSSSSEKSDASSSDASQIRTDATFLQLKKQFLEQDSQMPPVTYSTLKRQGKKPEPLTGIGNLRAPGFSDQDEYNQSPVAKYPPSEFPDVRDGQDHTGFPQDLNPGLKFSLPSRKVSAPVGDTGASKYFESPDSPSLSQRSRREDLQSRVEKIAAGRRDPSPTKPLPAFGTVSGGNSFQLQLGDIPPAPDFAAPLPNHMNASPVGSNETLAFPPPPPSLQPMGGPPPPPPPPPPPQGASRPMRTSVSSTNNNNNQNILKPAGPKSKPPIKLMPDMGDLQRELQRRTSKQSNSSSVEEAIKRNQKEHRKEQSQTILTPLGGLQKLEDNPPKKPARPPATKRKPVAPPPVKPKSPVSKELPRDDEQDVDIFSQKMDAMELSVDSEDVIESDSSDMESALSGFENENTDTIKKQPSKASPPRMTLKLSNQEQQPAAPLTVYKPKIESPGISWEEEEDDDDDGMSTVKRRPKADKKEEEPKRDSLGEAMEKLEALLNSPDGELVMSDFDSANSTPEKKHSHQNQSGPSTVESKPPAPEASSMTTDEENKVFSDLESMFQSLALDLENMLQ
ncbi:uncharacterized protein [Apostichopus japonicus]